MFPLKYQSLDLILIRFCFYFGVVWFIRLKFTDMLITSGKFSSVLFCLSKQEGAVKIVPIVLNPLSMIQESKANALWTRKLFSRLQRRYTFFFLQIISLGAVCFYSSCPCDVIIDVWKTWICLSSDIVEWLCIHLKHFLACASYQSKKCSLI